MPIQTLVSDIPVKIKDPDAIVDYSVDWGENWLKGSDVIATSSWSISADDNIASPLLQIDSDAVDVTNKIATAWISGGKAGKTYLVTNRVNTTGGRRNDQSLFIKVQDK